MKQAHLTGRTKGLRPSQQRRLEALSHRRHPEREGADQATLERLADEVVALKQPLHLVLDMRGLCRLLFVGPLEKSDQILSNLSKLTSPRTSGWRLISCPTKWCREDLYLESQDAIVALDIAPSTWLCFSSKCDSDGRRAASLWIPDRLKKRGWNLIDCSYLGELCKGSSWNIQEKQHEVVSQDSSLERVLLLTLRASDPHQSDRDLSELEGLVRSAGAYPVAIVSQHQGALNPQTVWGKGKLHEVALEVRLHDASLVIADRELTPSQVRNLERLLDCPVMDRSELILDIFAQRASSSAGRMQVELAQLRYRMPRLAGRGRSLSRQGGGIGTRGPGETQLEKDRRAILRRIDRLKRDLGQLRNHRVRIRNNRNNLPLVAIVGYTNVGKSTLLNALTSRGAKTKIYAENKLFATLDPTTRRLTLPQLATSPKELLITDTVGFIRELPAPLMEAFGATLEETLAADLLLLVVDLSNHDWKIQLDTVNHLLDSLGATSIRQVVANQIDNCESNSIECISQLLPSVLYVSAKSGAGLQGLKNWLHDYFWGQESESDLGHNATHKYG